MTISCSYLIRTAAILVIHNSKILTKVSTDGQNIYIQSEKKNVGNEN